MKIEVRKDGSYWSIYVDDVRMVDRESYQVAQNIADEIEFPSRSCPSECAEVARSIRLWAEGVA